MMISKTAFQVLSLCAATLACSAAMAAETAPRTCFDSAQVNDWTVADDQTVFLQTRSSDYYRVDLATPVRQLKSHSARLTFSSKTNQICGVRDLGLRLALSPNLRVPLGASKITKLSAEEIAAVGLENLPGRRYRDR
jgi:hypothetical protein